MGERGLLVEEVRRGVAGREGMNRGDVKWVILMRTTIIRMLVTVMMTMTMTKTDGSGDDNDGIASRPL